MHWRFQVRRCQGYLVPSRANFFHFHAILEKTIWPNNRLVPHLLGWHTHLGNIGPVIDMVLDQKSKSRLSVDHECPTLCSNHLHYSFFCFDIVEMVVVLQVHHSETEHFVENYSIFASKVMTHQFDDICSL